MKQHLIVAGLVMLASSALADPVLVRIEEPPAWPVIARVDRPHVDEPPACDARMAIAREFPLDNERTRRHHRHRRRR